jgi:hypothetical protein
MMALGGLAILVLVLVMKLFTAKPKRAEKWEKAEIMKKLLALSEQEEKRSLATPAAKSAARPRPQPARPVTRPSPAAVKASTKVAMPVRAKAR